MLIIGHRGAKGLGPENTLLSLQAGVDAGADILEFDIRLTKDGVPILSHDNRLNGRRINRSTLAEIKSAGAVTTLESVLSSFFRKVKLNIELKRMADVSKFYDVLRKYVVTDPDYEWLLVSSFYHSNLIRLRAADHDIKLALLIRFNPFGFSRLHEKIGLSATGWHRFFVVKSAVYRAKQVGLMTYVYTVNSPDSADRFKNLDIDAIVTDHPELFKG